MRVISNRVLGMAAVLGLIVHGCGPSTASAPSPPEVREELLVSTAWLAEHLDDPQVKVVQVGRDRTDYDAGHIPGARFLAWDRIAAPREGVPNELPPAEEMIATVRELGIEDGDRVVLYDTGPGLAAARAYVAFDFLGLGDRAALLDGQFDKWQAEARPLQTTTPEVTPSAIEPEVQPWVVVPLAAMEALVWARLDNPEPGLVVVDTRPREHFTGEEPGRDIARGGHLPGAVHLYWHDHLTDSEVPVMRSPSELRRLYAEAGVGPGARVVTYCRTGVQASHTYFTLKYLGYDVRLYDGSFLEWNAVEELPVVAGP